MDPFTIALIAALASGAIGGGVAAATGSDPEEALLIGGLSALGGGTLGYGGAAAAGIGAGAPGAAGVAGSGFGTGTGSGVLKGTGLTGAEAAASGPFTGFKATGMSAIPMESAGGSGLANFMGSGELSGLEQAALVGQLVQGTRGLLQGNPQGSPITNLGGSRGGGQPQPTASEQMQIFQRMREMERQRQRQLFGR